MATQPRRNLDVGTILDRTVDTVSRNALAGLVFIAFFATLGSVTDFLSQGTVMRALLFQLIVSIATIFGTYFLVQAMLRRLGILDYDGPPRVLPFLGLGILTGIATALGFILFVIPGLILMARWSIASVLLIGEGKGVTEAMGESWETTRGSEMPIILSFVILLVLFIGASVAASLYVATLGLPAIILSKVAGSIGSVVSAAAGVAVYALFKGRQGA